MGPDTYQEASLKLPKSKLTRMEDIIREVRKGALTKVVNSRDHNSLRRVEINTDRMIDKQKPIKSKIPLKAKILRQAINKRSMQTSKLPNMRSLSNSNLLKVLTICSHSNTLVLIISILSLSLSREKSPSRTTHIILIIPTPLMREKTSKAFQLRREQG